MRHWSALLAGLLAALVVVLGAGRLMPVPRPPAPPPELAFWEWSGRDRVDDDVRAVGCRALYAWCGTVERRGDDSWAMLPRGGVPAVPADLALHLVVRCEASVATRLDGDPTELAEVIAAGVRARAGSCLIAGVQLDADVPVRLLGSYGRLLRAVRARLPAHWQLGSTMLLSWRHADGLADVAAAVDELVPQFYSVAGISRDGPVVGGGDLAAVAAALEHLGVAYRIGLPTIEQTALLRDGRVVAAAVPVSLEALLRAGLTPRPVFEPWGWGVRIDVRQTQSLGMVDLRPGDVLRVAMPTATGFARRVAEVRDLTGPHCRGIVLFRLPGPEATRTLSFAQIQAALADAVRPAHLAVRVEAGDAGWRVIIANPGDDDWLGCRRRAVVDLHGCRGPLRGHGAIVIVTTRDGTPCAPVHADGARIEIGLVPAGGQVVVSGTGAIPSARVRQ